MTTTIQDLLFTRGDPWRPGVLALTSLGEDGKTPVDVPAAAFTGIECLVWKKAPSAQPDGVDEDLLVRITTVASPDGVITVVGTNKLQILIHGAKTALWPQSEYFYAVRGVSTTDGEPKTFVKGRLQVTWGKGTSS